MVFSPVLIKVLCLLFLYFTAYYCTLFLHNRLDKWGKLSERQTQRRWRILMALGLIAIALFVDWKWSDWIVELFPMAVNFHWPMIHTVLALLFCSYIFMRFVWLKWSGSQRRCMDCGGSGFKTMTYQKNSRFVTGTEKKYRRYACSSCQGAGLIGISIWQVIFGKKER